MIIRNTRIFDINILLYLNLIEILTFQKNNETLKI